MVWPLLVFFISPAFAQIDLSAIQKLDDELPGFTDYKETREEVEFQRQNRKFNPPRRLHSLDEIKKSSIQQGAIREGSPLRNLETNESFKTNKMIYVKYHTLEDENGFKYLLNKDGSVAWRTQSQFVEPIKEELSLYVPPTKYTPASPNIVKSYYDKKLALPPEFSFYTGMVEGNYMKDLFDDNKARSGMSYQYGAHLFTQWKLPLKAGAVIHYEYTTYQLDNGGQITYTSPSLGPQIKTRNIEFFDHPIRFQAQLRLSPLAKATAKSKSGDSQFKFNSTDFLASIERPITNSLGEFVLGIYTQYQWLSIKDQTQLVDVKATNEINKSFGISFAQVFE